MPNGWHDPYPFRDNTNETYYIESTTTKDNTVYAAHWYNWSTGGEDYLPGIYAAKFIGDGVYHYELIFRDNEQNAVYDILRISSISNDVQVIWQDNQSYPYLRYSYKDLKPLAPQNLTITKSPNNHPLLSWTANKEPDIDHYQLYRWDSYGGGWQPLAQTSNTSYEDATLTYCTAVPPAQCENLRAFQFKVTAVDLGSHESEPSNIVETRLVGGPPSKAGADNPGGKTVFEYSLGQNYPNPFNPVTTIDYSIKSTGLVTLKAYDMLGTEVASLVNEIKEAGNYSVTFNASNLPSGIYFCTLSAGNFIATKKLILLK
ncbi:MAG: T9SS type A sorting domain-containing protein [Ignavibacteriaceae bacterium]|jgi:hypothetical protein|nr:T9SS type A sorting domain-containing protein [Ignavibacterium sp.]MCU0413919.1 T9SS type A sorting domain-containing protein [Ignavibacteriaceae bacterium]